jgi:hypothetical protein
MKNAGSSRSQLIQKAAEEKLLRVRKTRLARELAKIDPRAEKRLANERLAAEKNLWPEYYSGQSH